MHMTSKLKYHRTAFLEFIIQTPGTETKKGLLVHSRLGMVALREWLLQQQHCVWVLISLMSITSFLGEQQGLCWISTKRQVVLEEMVSFRMLWFFTMVSKLDLVKRRLKTLSEPMDAYVLELISHWIRTSNHHFLSITVARSVLLFANVMGIHVMQRCCHLKWKRNLPRMFSTKGQGK